MNNITLQDIYQAQKNIAGKVKRTPLNQAASLSDDTHNVFFKLESHQYTGSFKLRGATNAVTRLLQQQPDVKQVVGVSTGNHGKGLAYAAQNAGIESTICMSSLVPQNKVKGIKQYGANVQIIGKSQDEAQVEVDKMVSEKGMVMLPPFDHADVIAGQGTIALEVLEDLPAVDNVIVPVSGGGLISGVALAMKTINPKIKVYGVTMENGCAMYESQKAGKPVAVEEKASLADSLGGGIGEDNKYTFDIVRQHVDELFLVSEAQIADAISHAYYHEQEVIEGSGAVGIALLLSRQLSLQGNTVIVISGKNLDMAMHKKIINGEPVEL